MIEELQKTRSPFQLAEMLGISVGQARDLILETVEPLLGWGRLKMQPYIVSRRHVDQRTWPKADRDLILQHQKLQDQGRVSICQGRDGMWLILYAVPTARGKLGEKS